MIYSTTYLSAVGPLTIACDGDGRHLVGLWIFGQKYYGQTLPETMTENHDISLFCTTKRWLDRYFAGENPAVSELPLAPIGSVFRQNVWQELCAIPYGQVTTYGDIAKRVAAKMGRSSMPGQAVGGAVAHNPISIIIPCHRVVGTGGSLTGYAGGIDTKIKLLELENVDMSRLFIPKKGTAL